MIDESFVQKMSLYNEWQNRNLFGAADGLSDRERKRERGAFFTSIHGTLNHPLWSDQIWKSRFVGTPKLEGGIKESSTRFAEREDLKRERVIFDRTMINWTSNLDPNGKKVI